MTIGERIRAARERLGWSQADLVRASGFSSKLISYLENGNQKNTTIPTVIRLCDALNVSSDYLLGRVDDIEIMPLPKRLTAENGAKKTLIGEFFEDREVQCHECFGYGCDEWGDICEECEGAGSFTEKVDVTWTTIKAIWKAAVAHFENETNAKPPDFKS